MSASVDGDGSSSGGSSSPLGDDGPGTGPGFAVGGDDGGAVAASSFSSRSFCASEANVGVEIEGVSQLGSKGVEARASGLKPPWDRPWAERCAGKSP